jgi:hypothetical protein
MTDLANVHPPYILLSGQKKPMHRLNLPSSHPRTLKHHLEGCPRRARHQFRDIVHATQCFTAIGELANRPHTS